MHEELLVGPILRGIHAAESTTARTGQDGGSGRALPPGPLFRYVSGGDSLASEKELLLSGPFDPESIATAWVQYLRESGATPSAVRMPSGARWVSVESPQGAVAPQAVSGLLSPALLGATLVNRVTVVTGAAQGFGWEIARGLAALGAIVALADINIEGAAERARELGPGHAAFAVDVTSEDSVMALVENVTRTFGGFDLVVSNAGVLKAGSVTTLEARDFRFVTEVNYVGFFLMTKHVSPVMERQYAGARAAQNAAQTATGSTSFRPYLTDIVEINSKSGLTGSNRNAAYAGSKFGGIGLVQSFALELVEQGTKVNAICPGNYLDGPLWSDPERGLFVQYLHAGKVPGARTIHDVRRFYEEKVPMNRGCTGTDVVRALAYVVSQEYETGQAVPVTGGQVMLA